MDQARRLDAMANGEAARGSASGTVLVIDDEPVVRRVVQAHLERAGYSVLSAESGPEGIDCYGRHSGEIGVVLLDLTMPDMDGEAVFGELRKIRDDVRVILSSGYCEAEMLQRFQGTSIAGCIQKPYRAPDLLAAVAKAQRGCAPDEAVG